MNSKDYKIIGQVFVESGEKAASFFTENSEVNASSLGRVYKHIQKEGSKSWGIVTAYRDANSPAKNKANFNALKAQVRSLGLGFFVVQGVGQEENGTESHEPALFIPNIVLKQIASLSKKYDQYGFLYSGPESKNKVVLYSLEGHINIGAFHPMKVSRYFSKVKGKPFVFSSVEGNSFFERYANSL